MLKVGTEVRGYRIEGMLGHGGMGIVYEARQISLDRLVALKILSPELSTDVSFRERFRREGQIQAAIDHPNIVTVHEAGEIDEGLFIAMRIVRGPTLKDMVIGRELEAARTLRILLPIADALDSAHGAGLIHRDIKPQNILVGARDHPYLADFGLTKGANEAGLTRTGQFVGTIDYISPEQIRGEPAQPASDLYALAAVLYECLTGVVPYTKPSDAAVLFAHMSDPRPLVTEKRPDLPPALNDVIVRGMDLDPANRHASATELIKDAERAFGRRIRAALTPPGPIELPEEIGIREQEGKVPTRETRIREAAELAEAGAAAETRAAQPAAPSEVSPPAEETVIKPAADQTRPSPVAEPEPEAPAPEEEEPATPVPTADATAAARTRPVTGPTVPLDAGPTVPVDRPPVPPPPAKPAPAKRAPRERRAAPPLVPILVVAGLVAAVAGFLIGSSGGGDSEKLPALSGSAATGDIALNFPTTWKTASEPKEITGLKFTRSLGLERTGRTGTGLTAGIVDAGGPTLLPTAFFEKLPSPPNANDPVKLGKLTAFRYRNLRPSGFSGQVTMYTVPTSAGVATVACYRPTGAADDGECERIAASLRLEAARAYALGPDKAYGDALSKALTKLDSSRVSLRKQLAAAKTPTGQGSIADQLASAYSTAANSLAKLTVTPQVRDSNAAVVTSLRSTATVYKVLGSAARKQQASSYKTAQSSVTKAEKAVQSAVTTLGGLGYKSA